MRRPLRAERADAEEQNQGREAHRKKTTYEGFITANVEPHAIPKMTKSCLLESFFLGDSRENSHEPPTFSKSNLTDDHFLQFPDGVALNAVGRRNTQICAKERKKSANARAQKGAPA